MKAPIRCPHGCGFTLEMDWSKDHQHIQCHECLCEFCAICIGFFTIDEEEARWLEAEVEQTPEHQEVVERMRKAHLN